MRVLALFFFFMLTVKGIGQGISGMVQDVTARSLPGVTITLFKSNDKNIAAFSVTDTAGRYRFPQLDTGLYLLKAFAIGFDTAATEWLYVDNEGKMLSPLILQPITGNLQEVRVTARKPIIEVQPDKTVFNVEGSINAIGTNALELLQKAPGVLVDKDDNISVNGKNGVQVYIDGKPSPL
ncbi:MAG TPA: carboxypeptidase-like regulatory domain-containing protein, partial [Flavisolibacter sp.]|nr:carboxypeptidase-like regulatory domain-containing protein [Flavisolibacter sp.]